MYSNPVATSILTESPACLPAARFAEHSRVPGTEPSDDEEDDDSEPGTPAEPVQTPKNPGDA